MAVPGRPERASQRIGHALPRSVVALQRRISTCASIDELVAVLSGGLGALCPVKDRISVALVEPDGQSLRVYRIVPAADRSAGPLPRVKVEGTAVGRVVVEGAGQLVDDVWADPNITFGHASRDRIRSTVSVPIRVAGRVVGVLNAGSHIPGACNRAMLDEVDEIAAVVGPAIYAAERLLGGREPAAAASEETAGLVGRGAAFQALMAAARRAATSDAGVLITGETGVGKTALARAMHRWSARRQGPFVTVHIADLSSGLVESELFGHARGAFTGASSDRIGRFESAQGGTIFLDEVSEAPPPIQAKLLRVIQDQTFERVGGTRTLRSDVRIIAATSRDLGESIARGEFRKDLFYRLNVVPIHVPSLAARREDLDVLVGSILDRLRRTDGRGDRQLSPDAWRRVRAYDWPGNIRELESVLRRAWILEDGAELSLEGFPQREAHAAAMPAEWPTLEEHQRRYIESVLERCAGVIEGPRGAAKLLGMRPSTLRSRMERLGISARPMREKGRA